MRAGPSNYRRRSRSPVRPEGDVGARLNEAFEQYSRLIAEGRAGRRFQSPRKSLILTIIEYYLHLLELAITASGGARILRRKWQLVDICIAAKFANKLPLRSEPIIPGTDSDLRARTPKVFILHHQRTRNWSRELGIQLIRGRYLLGAGHRSQITRYREILGLQLQRHQQHRNQLHLLQQ